MTRDRGRPRRQTIVPRTGGTVDPEPDERLARAAQGLTAREAEIIALITQGLSNQEIAERSYLSINSVKTYIRTAYRKMGVTGARRRCCGGSSTASSPTRCGTSRRVRSTSAGRWTHGRTFHPQG